MKKFLKKASVYLLLLLLIAAAVFSLNFFLGRRLARDLEADLEEIAQENNYQLRYLSIKTNPLLKRVEIDGLSLLKSSAQSLEINGAEIEFTWQQIFNYLKEREFLSTKDLKAEIDKFTFYDLQQNNNFTFYNSSLSYQGKISSESLQSPLQFIENDHKISFFSEEVNYDYPYYRSYGFSKDNWERISSFKNFSFKGSYQSQNNSLTVNDFLLKNEFLDYELDFESIIEQSQKNADHSQTETETDTTADESEKSAATEADALEEIEEIAQENNFSKIVLYSDQKVELMLKELKSNYSLVLNGELLKISENQLFNELKFNKLDLLSDFAMNFNEDKNNYQLQKFDLDFNLSDFNLKLSENLSQKVNEDSFGILAQDNAFFLKIESLKYQQDYSQPRGENELNLVSNLLDAQLQAEFNYNKEVPYISNSVLKFKSKNSQVEQLLLFAQILYGEQFQQDEEGYYYLESWGSIDDLNFE